MIPLIKRGNTETNMGRYVSKFSGSGKTYSDPDGKKGSIYMAPSVPTSSCQSFWGYASMGIHVLEGEIWITGIGVDNHLVLLVLGA